MSDVSTRLWITVLDGILCIRNADSLIDLDPFFYFSWWWFLGSFEGDKNRSIPFPALRMVLLFSVLTLLVNLQVHWIVLASVQWWCLLVHLFVAFSSGSAALDGVFSVPHWEAWELLSVSTRTVGTWFECVPMCSVLSLAFVWLCLDLLMLSKTGPLLLSFQLGSGGPCGDWTRLDFVQVVVGVAVIQSEFDRLGWWCELVAVVLSSFVNEWEFCGPLLIKFVCKCITIVLLFPESFDWVTATCSWLLLESSKSSNKPTFFPILDGF